MFLKTSQNSPENTYPEVSFSKKLEASSILLKSSKYIQFSDDLGGGGREQKRPATSLKSDSDTSVFL